MGYGPADLGGAVVREVLRADGKSVLALGDYRGRAVVIKILRAGEALWQAKFDNEIRVYQAFATTPPPVRVPRLRYTDGHQVLVIDHIPGRPASTERYPRQPLPAAVLDAVLDSITTFTGWMPPPGVLAPVFAYASRVERYHRAGFFDDTDRTALTRLLGNAGPVCQANHGDPLPGNLLLTGDGECALLDFEFTGLFLPGFDLAMLHTLLADTPGAQARIEALVGEIGIEVPFLVNRAMVLSRELRLHTELPDGELRERRLALLRTQWSAFRARLRTLPTTV
jgi:hypothetical protein